MPHVSAAATSALTLAAASGARELTLPGGIVVQLPSAVVGGPAQKSDDPAVLALYGELADAERRLLIGGTKGTRQRRSRPRRQRVTNLAQNPLQRALPACLPACLAGE